MQNDQEKRDEQLDAVKDIVIKLIANRAIKFVAQGLQSAGLEPKDMATCIDEMKIWNDQIQSEVARKKGEAA